MNKRSERTTYEVKHLLERDNPPGNVPFERQLRRIYNACLKIDEIDKRGAQPAQSFINKHFGGWSWQIKDPLKFQVRNIQLTLSTQ